MASRKLMGLITMAAAMGDIGLGNPPHTKEILQSKLKNIQKKPLHKGLKEFIYGADIVYAINQKNADKKAHKRGLIKAITNNFKP